MNGERQGYQAYLLRLWQVCSGGRWVWRATVESPHTGERQMFADLAGLFAYLERQTGGLDLIELAEHRSGEDERLLGIDGASPTRPQALDPPNGKEEATHP